MHAHDGIFRSQRGRDAGTFIAAVGADDSHKQESIRPAGVAKVVGDSLEQICSIGDTHHAVAKGLMREEDVHAELSEIVAGKKVGRASDDESSSSIVPACHRRRCCTL